MKNITTPDLGGAADVTVIEILVKPGDRVEKDVPVVTLESDKATMEIPSSDAGVIKEIKVKIGDKVSTGTVMLTVEAGGVAADLPDEKKTEAKHPKKAAPQKKEKPVKLAPKDEVTIIPASQVTSANAESAEDVHQVAGSVSFHARQY
jgi:pyruvate/2-oxoglutarate dehydrogenase complex dihydrolipoamide acyltransferase (E2) component